MTNIWRAIESLADGNHVGAEWAKCAGEHFDPLRTAYLRDARKRARFIPCPHGCGCEHEVVERAGGALFGVCRCEPWNCADVPLTADEAKLFGFNAAKFGRAVRNALECEARETTLPLPLTWQIGAKFANGLPLFLTIQGERAAFRRVVMELAARQREPFVLLAPTGRWLDASSREMLDGSRAGFIDLETNLTMTASGVLQPRRSPGELLQAFAPRATEPDGDDVVRQAWGLLERLDDGKEPSLIRVFRLYGKMEMTADQVADACGCSKGTVINRLRAITKKTGLKPENLRRLSAHFGNVESEMSDDKAKHIHRKALVHDNKEDDDESE